MAEYNPFDTGRTRRRTTQPFGISDPNQTGIPLDTTGQGINESGGGSYPNTGINPNGAYSGTQTGIPPTSGTNGPSTPATYAAPAAPTRWDQSSFASQFGSPNTQRELLAMEQQLAAQGIKILRSASGVADKLQFPNGQIVDVVRGATAGGGGAGFQWLEEDGMGGGGGVGYGGQQAGAGNGMFNDAIRQQLMAIMNQSRNPTDSPVFQNAVNAYGTQAQRGKESMRNAIAERMAASGQANSGAMDAQLLGAEQRAAEAKASFAGDLGVRMMEQQRQEILQALQMGANLMTEEQRLALQERLGMIDANLREQGLGLQQQQLTNQNNQWTSNMGWEQAQYADMMNRIPWQTIFGA